MRVLRRCCCGEKLLRECCRDSAEDAAEMLLLTLLCEDVTARYAAADAAV